MSREYADSKIKEALRINGGNMALARQQVVAWCSEDHQLLRALTRPHLDGIVAYQAERVASGRAEAQAKAQAKKRVEPKQTPQQEEQGENFGMDLLRAVATGATVFGHEDTGAPVKRRAASQKHIEAIHLLASRRQGADKK